MNGYIAFYFNQETEVYADSLYEAKTKAIKEFNPPRSKQHLVHVELVQVGDQEIVHTADF